MEKIERERFKYKWVKPAANRQNGFTVILYHGWGTRADGFTELANRIAEEGYGVIVPEIVYHDSRNPLTNHFDKEIMATYFWKVIKESIEEFEEFFQGLSISKKHTVLVGSSMGGFIATGIFAFQETIGGLANINGSGSFLLSEKIFRKMDGRPEMGAEEEHFLRNIDPVAGKNCAAPVLLLHGEADTTISIEGQEHYYHRLIKDGHRENIKFSTYPGVNHQFTDEMVKDLIGWLNQLERGQNVQFSSKKMTKQSALEILKWKYAEPYDFYNNDVTEEGLQELLDGSYSVLVDENEKLAGFFCTGPSAQVPLGNKFGAYDEERIDIGIGMNPGLTGQGYGSCFFSEILGLVKEKRKGLPLRLTVAAFNERAIHLYRKFGFEKTSEFSTSTTKFITMVQDGK